MTKLVSLNHKLPFILFIVLTAIVVASNYQTEYIDWGDDNMQYIYNSKPNTACTIVNGTEYAPSNRGYLFSLLLSVNKSGSPATYKNLILILYVLAGISVFLFLTSSISNIESTLISLCFLLNAKVLTFSNEILTEFLFITLLYAIYYLQRVFNQRSYFLIAILFGFLMHVRVAGLVFYFAFLLSTYIAERQGPERPKALKNAAIHLGIFLLVFFLIDLISFYDLQQRYSPDYSKFLTSGLAPETILENTRQYWRSLTSFTEQEVPALVNHIINFSAAVTLIIGLIASKIKKDLFLVLAIALYGTLLLIYPHHTNNERFLLPILPLFLFFMWKGIHRLLKGISERKQTLIISSYFLFLICSNYKTLYLAKTPEDIGPFDQRLSDDFNKIRQLTNENDVIAFTKPFAINLFCNRNSFALTPATDKVALSQEMFFLVPNNDSLIELSALQKPLRGPSGDTLRLNYFLLIKNKPPR